MRTRPAPGASVVTAALLVGATTLAFGAWALAAPRPFAEFIDFALCDRLGDITAPRPHLTGAVTHARKGA